MIKRLIIALVLIVCFISYHNSIAYDACIDKGNPPNKCKIITTH